MKHWQIDMEPYAVAACGRMPGPGDSSVEDVDQVDCPDCRKLGMLVAEVASAPLPVPEEELCLSCDQGHHERCAGKNCGCNHGRC